MATDTNRVQLRASALRRNDTAKSTTSEESLNFPPNRALSISPSWPVYSFPTSVYRRIRGLLLPLSPTGVIKALCTFYLFVTSHISVGLVVLSSFIDQLVMPFGVNFFGGVSFDPARDIPSLEGKVILVTGGNNGLGKQAILELAKHNPASIYMASRSVEKAEAAKLELSSQIPDPSIIHVLQLDLASFASVRAAADTFLAAESRLDILMLNAGIMASPAGLTVDGYEMQFGTNHMGHALLTKLLLPVLEKTATLADADVRVVSLSSAGHSLAAHGIDFESLQTTGEQMTAYTRYGQSKLANILFARQLAQEHPTIKSVSVHPGVVRTNLMSGTTGTLWILHKATNFANNFFTPVEKGALNQLWAATAPTGDVINGEYYTPVGITKGGSSFSEDLELAKKLWDWTEEKLEGYLKVNKE